MDKNKTKHVIVLSINPVYAHAILLGQKTVEFRRNGVPSTIKKIVIYSTKPDQKLLGYCDVTNCIIDTPEKLWQDYGKYGYVSHYDFLHYYKGYKVGKCYILENPRSFKLPVSLERCKTFSTAPQSFAYLDKSEWRNLRRKIRKEVKFTLILEK
ncbi:MAG: ASCH domain-containing protein [Desulfobacteraceae bacterium]|nr:ASCH domain-containing protein [Desulfobacteraceae bacterium]